MNKSLKRAFSTVIAAAMVTCFPLLSTNSQAENSDKSTDKVAVEITSESNTSAISKGDIPECMAFEAAEISKFTARLYEKEATLDTVLFANKDGSETIYIFDENVKYINENGEVMDKTNKLYSQIDARSLSSDYSYVNKDNDINTFFPKSLMTEVGVSVETQGQNIEMYPISDVVSKVTADNDLYGVYYDDVFGEFTGIHYKPSFSGYKEEIILEKNVGNKFGFVLETGNLIPILENGVIYIRDTNGANFGIISPTYVYDSFTGDLSLDDERHFTYDNEFKLTRISDGKYELIVVVDEEFLNNSATVYPVIVDPSVTISSTGSGSGKSILDTPIYTGSGAVGSAGSNVLAVIGYVDSSYKSGRLLMSFPGLMTKDFMNNPNYVIKSAELHMSEVSGRSANAKIGAYLYNGSSSWSESSLYSSSLWNGAYKRYGVEQLLDSCSFSYPNATKGTFDVTDAVKLWQSNPHYRSNGIILKNETNENNSTYAKAFYTTEGDTKPSLSVTYSNRSYTSTAMNDYGLPTKKVTIRLRDSAQDSTWRPIIDSACRSWNNSRAATSISTTTENNGNVVYWTEIYIKSRSEEGYLGLANAHIMGGQYLGASIYIYSDAITEAAERDKSSGSSYNLRNYRQSVVAHEIAHLFWLDDEPNTSKDYSLMDYGIDHNLIYTPQMFDIYHMLTKY